jgi:hypothetical protein
MHSLRTPPTLCSFAFSCLCAAALAQTPASPSAVPNPFSALGNLFGAGKAASEAADSGARQQRITNEMRNPSGTQEQRAVQLLRNPQEMETLFGQKTVTARDVLKELEVTRKAVAAQNLNMAMVSFFGQSNATPGAQTAQQGGFFGKLMSGDFLSAAVEATLDLLITDLSYKKLEEFFNTMSERNDVLDKVTVDLPNVASSNPQMRQSVLGMAAMIAAIKASSMMLEGNEKSLEAIKASQLKLMDTRRDATKLMAEALLQTNQLDAKAQIAEFKNVEGVELGAEEKEFLNRFKGRPVDELLKDFGAQNVALDYLKRTQPGRWESYRSELVELKTRTNDYTRTAAGVTSATAFTVLFFKRAKTMLETGGLEGASAVLPLTIEGIKEAAGIGRKAMAGLFSTNEPLQGTFLVRDKDGKIVRRGLSAERALATVSKEDLTAFGSSLIRDDTQGEYNKIYRVQPQGMAEIVDRLASKETKKKYAVDRMQIADATDFSFQNVLSPAKGATVKQIGQLGPELFSTPMVANANSPEDQAVALVQKDLMTNTGKLINKDVRNMMFAVLPTGIAKFEPELNVGGAKIEIDAPGAQGLTDYDDWLTAVATRASAQLAAQKAAQDAAANAAASARASAMASPSVAKPARPAAKAPTKKEQK